MYQGPIAWYFVKIAPPVKEFKLRIKEVNINQVHETKRLVIITDNTLSWTKRINNC